MNFEICKANGKIKYQVIGYTKTRTFWIGAGKTMEDAKELIQTFALDNRIWINSITIGDE